MARRTRKALPQEVDELRAEIDDWRKTKARRTSPMPAALWMSAGLLARVHGTYSIAKALRLAPDSLKRRALSGVKTAVGVGRRGTPFVELWPGSVPRGERHGDSVEITNVAGDKLVIHLAAGNRLDAVALAAAFVNGAS
jgi:hypothetical protein